MLRDLKEEPEEGTIGLLREMIDTSLLSRFRAKQEKKQAGFFSKIYTVCPQYLHFSSEPHMPHNFPSFCRLLIVCL